MNQIHIRLIGLGKMGLPLALNMMQKHRVTAYDADPAICSLARQSGITVADSLDALAQVQDEGQQRIVWLMVPAGEIVDRVLDELLPLLSAGDIVVDGGNSFFRDSVRRSAQLAEAGIHMLDCGTSGGVEGARNGICAMVGGKREAFERLEPVIRDISLPGGYLYCGASGTGHFVKMVHNGIEYGMMQAIAEGIHLMHAGPYRLDLPAVAALWNQGSVIRGWLMELTGRALRKDPELGQLRGVAHASGEAQWMVDTARSLGIPVPVTEESLRQRYLSQREEHWAAKVVAALRFEFGGHGVESASKSPGGTRG